MIALRPVALLLAACALPPLAACRPADEHRRPSAKELAEREALFLSRVAAADRQPQRGAPVARWIMPRELAEISGLAVTDDGRLLAHGDEVGRVFVLDPRHGQIVKRFSVGNPTVHGDFEGITMARGSIYLIASNGTLYELREGADGAHVSYATFDTKLGKECEFEGVAYDSASASLLMPCKRVGMKKLRDQLVIFRWKLDAATPRLSTLTVPLSDVVGSNDWSGFNPSDITIDPASGNYIFVAAKQKALVEITPAGAVVRSMRLPGKHPQPEGIAITRDGLLIVSDEASNSPATITVYRWQPASGAGTSGTTP